MWPNCSISTSSKSESDPVLEELKAQVLAANLELPRAGLVTLTWGNVSGRDKDSGLVVIKPSGVPYSAMSAEDMVVVDDDGAALEGSRRPSTDTPTHLALYRGLPGIGGVVHTHSTWATAWAQARRPIPVLGTTHADLCPEPVPVTEAITPEQVSAGYEIATGAVILAAVGERAPTTCPVCWLAATGHSVGGRARQRP